MEIIVEGKGNLTVAPDQVFNRFDDHPNLQNS